MHGGGQSIDWSRLARRALTVLPLVLAAGVLLANVVYGHAYGADFRGGMWTAGHAILAGRSPYPKANAASLLHALYGYVPPPFFSLVAVPFALLPWAAAIAAWNVVSIAAFALALHLVGVRDGRVYALAVCSLPFVLSLGFGQTEGLLALGLAAAWRWRDSAPGPVAVGAVIAAKLIVWPLLIWLVVTRRIRSAAAALGVAVGLIAGGWAAIGFKGFISYPKLLAADGRAFSGRTHSVAALLLGTGVNQGTAELLAAVVALTIGGLAAYRARHDDQRLFMIAVGVSLLASPMLEMHYVALLFVPLAIARPSLDALWLFAANIFWLSPHDPAHEWQIALVLLSVGILVARGARKRPTDDRTTHALLTPALAPQHLTARS